jgi:hypothetical protein
VAVASPCTPVGGNALAFPLAAAGGRDYLDVDGHDLSDPVVRFATEGFDQCVEVPAFADDGASVAIWAFTCAVDCRAACRSLGVTMAASTCSTTRGSAAAGVETGVR